MHWFMDSRLTALDRLAKQVHAALGTDRPVTLWSVEGNRSLVDKLLGRDPQEGLVDNHVYLVESIVKDAKGEWQVTLRNPWATNSGVEGGTTAGASIAVPLRTLVDTGGLEAFTVGPTR